MQSLVAPMPSLRTTLVIVQFLVPAILGLLGIMVTLKLKSFHDRRGLVIVICVVLVVVPCVATAWNQHLIQESETAHTTKETDLTRAVQNLEGTVGGIGRQLHGLPDGILLLSEQPGIDLHIRARLLSSAILTWLVERDAQQPPGPRPGSWDDDVRALLRFDNETGALFAQKFASDIVVVRNELAAHGHHDEDLDMAATSGVFHEMLVRSAAIKLGAMAQQVETPQR